MKRLLFFIFGVLLGFCAEAQIGQFGNFYGIRLVNGTETRVGSLNGTIYYDPVLQKFRFRENNIWKILEAGGAGTIANGDKGDITTSGDGVTWLIDNSAVTFAKIQNLTQARFLGRANAAGSGPPTELTGLQATAILPLFSTTEPGLTPESVSGGSANFLRADGIWAVPPGTGGAGSGTTETASNGLNKVGSDIRLGGPFIADTELSYGFDFVNERSFKTNFYIDGDITNKVELEFQTQGGGLQGSLFGYSDVTHYAGILAGANGNASFNFVNGAQNAQLEFISATNRVTFTDARTVKRGMEYAAAGYVTQPRSFADKDYVDTQISTVVGAGITNGDKGDITVTDPTTWTVDPGAITFSKFQNISASRFLGRSSGSTGNVQEFSAVTAATMLPDMSTTGKGMVPISPGGTTAFLRADGTWTAPAGGSSPGLFNATTDGIVPASGGGTNSFLRADASWVAPPFWKLTGTSTLTGATTINTSNNGLNFTTGNGMLTFDGVAGNENLTIQNYNALDIASHGFNLNVSGGMGNITMTSTGDMTFNGPNAIKYEILALDAEGKFTGLHRFTPSSARAGINIGVKTAVATVNSPGDMYMNTLGDDSFNFSLGGSTWDVLHTLNATGVVNRLPYYSTTTGRLVSDAGIVARPSTDGIGVNEVWAGSGSLNVRADNGMLIAHGETGVEINASSGDGVLIFSDAGGHTNILTGLGTSLKVEDAAVTIAGAPIIIDGVEVPNDNTNTRLLAIGGGASSNLEYRTVASLSIPTVPTGGLSQGTYTPTITNVTNMNNTIAQVTGYYRVGNMVTVAGTFSVDAIAGSPTLTEVRVSLPVASNFTATTQLGGSGTMDYVSPIFIFSDPTTDTAWFKWEDPAGVSNVVSFSFTYRVL